LKRHAGLSAFLLDMRADGVEVRTIRQMTGGAEFCEVFLTDAFVPNSHLIGEAGSGWTVVLDVLMNERSSIGGELLPPRDYIDRLVNALSPDADLHHRSQVAQVVERYEVGRLLIERLQESARAKGSPGPELALTKLVVTNIGMEMSAVASLILGPRLIADSGDHAAYAWSEFLLGVPGMRIGGGTDEVLKNQVAERILELPRT
jgi:acyl-CoA dehydrogenase